MAYLAITIIFTWPLVRGLAHDIAGDFGDPLLNAWIVAWDAAHLGRGWWNANIYHPHPLALAYSEHLLPQALQVLPIEAATKNPILSYNLLWLSTFVLSGLGMFLFAREITGNAAAGFVAGIAYAFAPYRVTSMPHLQILSSQWLPFALYGFRRFFSNEAQPVGAARALVAGTAAWMVQNLSCGYYFLFFTPVIVIYTAWEMSTRSLWRNRRVVAGVAIACATAIGVTALFMLPYLELRRLGFNPRSLEETTKFSADVYAYATADPNLIVWGSIVQAWPKAEGALFPGFTIVALAMIGAWTCRARLQPSGRRSPGGSRYGMHVLTLATVVLIMALLLGWTIRLPGLKIASFTRALATAAAVWAIVLGASAEARRAVRAWLASPSAIFVVIALFGVVMSWGPSIQARGRTIAPANLYSVFYAAVPGFDGVRVPARFAMAVVFALAVLAGLGFAALTRGRRTAFAAAAAAALLVLVESIAVPIPINQNPIDYRQAGLAPLPASVADVPRIYEFVRSLEPAASLLELPLGEPAFDVRYMLYSTRHWRPLVNGYSGGAPADYEQLDLALQDAATRPDRAWLALAGTQASHVIVHERLYAGDRGRHISDWLLAHNARELAALDGDRIFRIR